MEIFILMEIFFRLIYKDEILNAEEKYLVYENRKRLES